MPLLLDKGECSGCSPTPVWKYPSYDESRRTDPSLLSPVPSDASCTDKMDELSDADVSRGPAEPAVKRERIEMSHPLQEM